MEGFGDHPALQVHVRQQEEGYHTLPCVLEEESLKEFTFIDQLTTLRLTDTELTEDMVATIEIHTTLTCVELTRCTTPLSAWELIIPALRDFADSGLQRVLLRDCIVTVAGTIINCQWDNVPDGPIPATFQFHLDFYSLSPPTDAVAAPEGESHREEIPRP
jgi:hypothetical protein